jgi:nucleotide-binding universal stress UspA family protein
MMVVSGTDFSANAAQAVQAAAAIAKRLSVPLKLVHVIDELRAELAIASDLSAVYEPLRQRTRDQAMEWERYSGMMLSLS